jgi:hypothetical protein
LEKQAPGCGAEFAPVWLCLPLHAPSRFGSCPFPCCSARSVTVTEPGLRVMKRNLSPMRAVLLNEMAIEIHRRAMWLLALLAGVAAGLLPGSADAKFTCEDRGLEPEGIVLRGLPASPIAGRSYTLTVTLLDGYGPNSGPNLGAQYCGESVEPKNAPGIDAWFRRVGGAGSPVFSADVRFPRPGPWALSVMDLDGYFYDFGLRDVRATSRERAKSRERATTSTAGAGGSGALTWLVVGAALAIAAGAAAVVRHKQGL